MPDAAVIWTPTLASGLKIAAGTSSFSTVPTIAEINSSSDHNQIIALVNRRTHQVLPGLTAFSYVAAGGKPMTAAIMAALRTRINALRAGVNVSAYTFTPTTINAGDKLKAAHFSDLQTALGFSGNWSANALSTGSSGRVAGETDRPYGTFATSAITGSGTNIGKHFTTTGGGTTIRTRQGLFFAVPASAGSGGTFTLTLKFLSGSWQNAIETFLPQLYSSNTDDSAFSTGWQNNLNNNLGASAYNVNSQALSIPGSIIAARAGSKLSLILGEDAEMVGGGSGGVTNNTSAGFTLDSTVNQVLSADYGF